LPILLLFVVVSILFIVYFRRARHYGLNIPAASLICINIFCMGIDILINYYKYNSFNMTWSWFVALTSMLPATLLFFIHYRFKKLDFKKTFHV
jgi:hypothetical protein